MMKPSRSLANSTIGLMIALLSLTIFLFGTYSNGFFLLPLAITFLLIANLILCFSNIRRKIIFSMFQLTFFLFLVSGPFLAGLSGENFFYQFSSQTRETTLICYWISAFSMYLYLQFGSHLHMSDLNQYLNQQRNNRTRQTIESIKVRRISLYLYYITVILEFIVIAEKIAYRQIFSLQSYYAEYWSNTILPVVIIKIADCYLIAFTIFLATKPSKKEAKVPVIIFLVMSATTLLYGVRHVIILNLILLTIYAITRNEEGSEIWLSKKMIIIGIILIPFVIIFLQAFDIVRRNVGFGFSDLKGYFSFELLKEFFTAQSISSNILSHSIESMSRLEGQPVPYTFGTLYNYIKQNMIIRLFTGVEAYGSNSVEAAMYGGNLGARLAYILYPISYLAGTGMGGSFIADLYVDWSYIGVAFGSYFVFVIIGWISKRINGTNIYLSALLWVAIRWIIYMPRDSYFSWAIQTFSILNILFVLSISVFAKLRLKIKDY